MLVLLGVAALAVLAGVVVVAVGRGGQMADFAPDYPSVELPTQRPIAGTDVALMRLPLSLWGYHVRAVDEALRRVAFALSERDSRIATLEQRIIELRGPRNSWEPERDADSATGTGMRNGTATKEPSKTLAEKGPAEKGSADGSAGDEGSTGKSPAGSGTADESSADATSADKSSADKSAAGKGTAEKESG